MYREGGIIGKNNTPTGGLPGTASGLWTINEIHNARFSNIFPGFLVTSTTASLNTITNVPINVDKTTTSSDSTRAFDIVDVLFTSGSSAGHKFYIQIRPRGPTSFYNDLCIGAFQVIKASDNSIAVARGGGDTSDLQTNQFTFNPVLLPSHNVIANDFTDVASGSTNSRWNIASGTSSSFTGAQGGIHNQYSNNGTSSVLLPTAGFGVLTQFNVNNYIYFESSGNTTVIDLGCYLKLNSSISLDTSTDYIFRIAYNFTTHSSNTGATNTNIMYVFIEN